MAFGGCFVFLIFGVFGFSDCAIPSLVLRARFCKNSCRLIGCLVMDSFVCLRCVRCYCARAIRLPIVSMWYAGLLNMVCQSKVLNASRQASLKRINKLFLVIIKHEMDHF